MSKNVLVVAPHPDDELLGCGGTVLKYIDKGFNVAWLICTEPQEGGNWSDDFISKRKNDINKVAELIKFKEVFELKLPAALLDDIPMGDIISKFSEIYEVFKPNIILTPHRGDAHSDHRVLFDVVSACSKWFRYPYVNEIYAYETPSETEFNLKSNNLFNPNVFIDISNYLDKKIEAIQIYDTEIDKFPFPRSIKTIEALAKWRGSNSGFEAAEAFELILKRT